MAPKKQKSPPMKKAPVRKRSGRLLYGPFHPWRICPVGEHWVRAHEKTSKKGNAAPWSGHCRKNPSGKDQLYPQEMGNIAEQFFPSLNGPPAADNLGFNKPNHNGNAFDYLIRGWTKYWNEVFQPREPLDPNLVKALIATESSFNPNADTKRKGPGRARGLMQLTDATRKILLDEEGELKEHYINVSDDDAYNPNLNIGAGIRWLHRKRELASRRLRREATWEEAALEYKDVLRSPRSSHEKKKFPEIRKELNKFYERLKRGGL
jgi:hypothetical protein